MYVTDKAEILIDSTPATMWEYATDPENWTVSNPEERYGQEYDAPENRRGRQLEWLFTTVVDGKQELYDHTNEELVYVKDRLESGTVDERVANADGTGSNLGRR